MPVIEAGLNLHSPEHQENQVYPGKTDEQMLVSLPVHLELIEMGRSHKHLILAHGTCYEEQDLISMRLDFNQIAFGPTEDEIRNLIQVPS
jgi:hypothetical protein